MMLRRQHSKGVKVSTLVFNCIFFFGCREPSKKISSSSSTKKKTKKTLNYRVCNKDSLNFFWWRDNEKKRTKRTTHIFL